MIPRLKPAGWERGDDEVRVVLDPRASAVLTDTDGAVTRLLELLAEGGRTIPELAAELARTHPGCAESDVAAAVEALNELRLVEDERRMGGLSETERSRHFSNLAFFRTFTSLDTSAEDVVRRLRASHVLVLGVGGLGSNVLQNLCGLGVGRLTLVDRDVVEERNFARQFVYRARDIGRVKVKRAAEWVREFDPTIEVEAIQTEFTRAEDVAELVKAVRPDAVSAGVDSPNDIDQWVNAACVAVGVPFCRAGMYVTEAMVWSVDPGRSACLACHRNSTVNDGANLRVRLAKLHADTVPRTNRGAGPVAAQLGSLVAFELTRFLTGITPPAYSGAVATIDLASDCGQTIVRGDRSPDCPVCGDAALGYRR